MLVPDPGEHWLEVTAALVDVLRVVVLRAPAAVDARAAGVLDARLRTRSGVLVVWGEWPRVRGAGQPGGSRSWSGPPTGPGPAHPAPRRRSSYDAGRGPPQRADLVFGRPRCELVAEPAVAGPWPARSSG